MFWKVGGAVELIRFMLLVHFVFVSVELPRSHNNNSHVAWAFRKGLQDHESVWPASAVNHIQPDLSWSLRKSGSKVKQLFQTISHGKPYFMLVRCVFDLFVVVLSPVLAAHGLRMGTLPFMFFALPKKKKA